MKTAMRETSLDAYTSIAKELPKREQQVYNLLSLEAGDLTNSEIALRLGWPINCVTGRTNNLVKRNLIMPNGNRFCTANPTGREVIAWKIIRSTLF